MEDPANEPSVIQNQSEIRADTPDEVRPQIEYPPAVPPPQIPLWKTLIRCNPFYLFSALLLIYGVYRASIDPHFFSTENRQVIFNFGSLEIYGLMLVGTAVFLARRRIHYDATLLLFLENVLVLIPFILISHAVVLDPALARGMSVLAVVLVAAKFGGFKGFFPQVNLSGRLLLVGSMILIVNGAIPLVFRRGLDLDNELWTLRSQYCWYILLPVLALAGHVLNPLSRRAEITEEHRKEWIPLTVFLLWITGTAAHLYSVGYVDDQKFELAKFSILAWAISWLLCAKITLVVSRFTPLAPEIMLSLPIATSFLAMNRPEFAVLLNLLNAVIFGALCVRWQAARLPAILGGISILTALFTMPAHWITPWATGYSRGALLFMLVNALLIVAAIRIRTAKWGWVGAICIASVLLAARQEFAIQEHYAVQMACAFLFIHSLFWKGPQESGSRFSLALAGILWATDSALLGRVGSLMPILPLIGGLPLLALALWRRNAAFHVICAAVVMLIAPMLEVFSAIQKAPAGMVALAASFLLFGVGTAFAIWKRRFSG